jgi:hypothetical protein
VDENASDFREALMELVETTYPEPAEHPSQERWLAYQRGELPADEEASLAEHLVRCRDCFDLLQAADALFGPAEEPGTGDELASTALWRQLRPQLFGDRDAQNPSNLRTLRPARRFRFPYALAAALFVALLGMTVWGFEERSALLALRAPRPNAPIYDFSAGERLSTPGESGERTLAAGSGPWMLVFHPSEELPVYRLAIRDAATGRELSSHDLRPDADLALTLDLPEGLARGRYRLEISGGSGDKGDKGDSGAGPILETHLLRVTPARRGG